MQITKTTASFSRATGTTQYQSGDLVANHATAGSVVPMTFNLTYGKTLKLHRVELLRSSTTVTDAQFRLHLYGSSPTVVNGDNAAFSTNVAGYMGYIDIEGQAPAFTDDAKASGVPLSNSVFAPMLIVSDSSKIYGLLEARDTYTPADSEVFTITLVGEAYV